MAARAAKHIAGTDVAEVKRTAREGPTNSRRPADAAHCGGSAAPVFQPGIERHTVSTVRLGIQTAIDWSAHGPRLSHQIYSGPDESCLHAVARHLLSDAREDNEAAAPLNITVAVWRPQDHQFLLSIRF